VKRKLTQDPEKTLERESFNRPSSRRFERSL